MLKINNLRIEFHTFDGVIHAVNGFDLCINNGEIIGIVGESGCGKSVATHAILQLIPEPPGRYVGGEIIFQGKDLLALKKAHHSSEEFEKKMRSLRGKEIAMIFQEPMTSLNPVFTIGEQMKETLRTHFPGKKNSWYKKRIIDSLKAVGISEPESRLESYPHHLSGGMRQRIMISMALSCEPQLLIADEPTTALDVTIQAQILQIIKKMRSDYGMAVLLITHNLALVAEVADQIAVMYAGRIIEQGPQSEIFLNPSHPYTIGLLESLPEPSKKPLKSIPGNVPDMKSLPVGCAFYNRCSLKKNQCLEQLPSFYWQSPKHKVACWLYEQNNQKIHSISSSSSSTQKEQSL